MYERCGLERLTCFFLGKLVRREFAQFLIDQRQELPSGARIAPLYGSQDIRDIIHRRCQWTGRGPRLQEYSPLPCMWIPFTGRENPCSVRKGDDIPIHCLSSL